MALPRVKILFENGALGSVTPSDDGVVGLLASGVATFEKKMVESDVSVKQYVLDEETKKPVVDESTGKLEIGEETEIKLPMEVDDKEKPLLALEEVYLLTSLKDLNQYGIKEKIKNPEWYEGTDEYEGSKEDEYIDDPNINIYNTVKEFYSEAPTGSKLWLMVVKKELSVTDMFKGNENIPAQKLIEAAKGAINLLIVKKTDDDPKAEINRSAAGIGDGLSLEADVYTAMNEANKLAVKMTEDKFAPFFVLLEGRHYNGTPAKLVDLTTYENNRVGILIADTAKESTGACVGLLAGRIAAIPVQRSIARVKTGAIGATALYIGEEIAEDGKPDVINDYGYITARTFVGKAGYYWSDDKLATKTSDDYALIPRRRIIDKAYRIAYNTLVEEVGEEIPVTDAGEIPAPIAKSIQNKVERAIENNMTAFGNLGNDPSNANDTGVTCYIDPKQNIMADSFLRIQLRVKPYAYAKYIDVFLGFKTVSA